MRGRATFTGGGRCADTRGMDAVTPTRAFKWSWIACAVVGGVLALLGLVTVNEYGVAAGFILAAIWGPILGAVASAATWAIRTLIRRVAAQ
jgi:hypothetical protein